MKRSPTPLALLILSAFSGAAAPAAPADDATARVTLSDPAKPCTLKVRVSHGDIRVHGADTDQVTVIADAIPENKVRADGLRVLTSAASYSFVEKNNVVTLESDNSRGGASDGDFRITVPRNAALVLTDLWGGEITCTDLKGDIDIRCHNAEVRLENVSGGATVETLNGEIYAKIAEVHDNHPLCFTSLNGKVAISLPQATKANVRLRTQNGAILTDFADTALVTKTEILAGRSSLNVQFVSSDSEPFGESAEKAIRDASRQAARAAREATEALHDAAEAVREGISEDGDVPRPPMPPVPPLPPMTGGKIVSGTLNGGGVDIQAATMNGDVVIRKY